MRILSWNINGVRTLPKYYPWNSFTSFDGVLDALNADIICFQEMKSARSLLPRDVAVPEGYHSFFSFPINKGGYSGVAVYTKSANVAPLKAEEGLSGTIQPKPPLSQEERVSPAYPHAYDIDAFSDENGHVPSSFDELDAEGRALVLDFGLFVLINVYCPAETSDDRLPYKMNFHLLLEERVRKLIEEEHREVIVIGDINVAATPMDHPDGHLASVVETFYDHPPRAWLRRCLDPNGPMVDVIRTFWPDRKGLYTCWNMKLQARETNYGARIDYVLVTKGLLPWIKHGDIQASLKGSDHCPIYIDLHDELTLESGETVTLHDAMKQNTIKDPPRIAAKFWEEFAGKQTVLSSFFGKRSEVRHQSGPESEPSSDPPVMNSAGPSSSPPTSTHTRPSQPKRSPHKPPRSALRPANARAGPSSLTKRKSSDKSANNGSNKKKKVEPGQADIASFFGKSSTSESAPKETIVVDSDTDCDDANTANTDTAHTSEDNINDSRSFQDLLASQAALVAESEATQIPSSSPNHSKNAWSNLLAPLRPPKCIVHDEATKLYTVNKPGPNKGKTFYICSRPVGPGYDKGKGERLRDEVDHQYRCNYFKWASEVKREALQSQQSKSSGAVGADSKS